jgi:hypothetical protein
VIGSTELTQAENLKFDLLARGLALTEGARAHIVGGNGDRPMSPADYASTSGLILCLEGEVWVNAPVAEHNPNFVADPACELDVEGGHLVVRGGDVEVPARFWLPPRYHEGVNGRGEPYSGYAFTHGDRVRVSPIEGCSMTCKFCDLPYEFRYRTKRVEGVVDSVRVALADEVQPAAHVLISGGTPRDRDIDYVREVYEAVITGFPEVAVDIMMVPIDGLLDAAWLDALGVNELSVNIEVYDREIAGGLMRRKAAQGLDHYLEYIEKSSACLGEGRVRSMLMVGLEPLSSTLEAVAEICRRGGTPVLSPFRPDPVTPLRDEAPPSAADLREAYLRARDVVAGLGGVLGPTCAPCTHNTLAFAGTDGHRHDFGQPNLW